MSKGSSFSGSSDSIGLLLFAIFIYYRLVNSSAQALKHWTGQTPAKTTFDSFHHIADGASHGRRREIEYKRVQTGIKSAAEQSLVPPERTFPLNDANDVRDVIGAKTKCKD